MGAIIHVATAYQVVQKFCFYCPQPLSPDAKRLADLDHEVTADDLTFIPAATLDTAEIQRLYGFSSNDAQIAHPDDPYVQPVSSTATKPKKRLRLGRDF